MVPGLLNRLDRWGAAWRKTFAALRYVLSCGGCPGCCFWLCAGPLRLRPTGRSLHVERLSASLGLTHHCLLHPPPPALLCPTDTGRAL